MSEAAPYRPSNGTEGEGFMSAWCGRCVRDQASRDDPDGFDGCPIIANIMAYRIDDPEYPKAWVVDENGPRCTEFSAVDSQVQPIDPAAAIGRLL